MNQVEKMSDHLEKIYTGNEHRLHLALRSGKMFAFEWDSINDEIVYSPESAEILGLNGNGIHDARKNYLTRIHEADCNTYIDILKSLTPQNPSYAITYRFVRPNDHNVIWLEERGQAFFSSEGECRYRLGITSDITVRKHLEKELQVLKNQLTDDLMAMTCLHIVSQHFMRLDAPGKMFDKILQTAVNLTKADMGVLQFVEFQTGQLKVVASHGIKPAALNSFHHLQESHACCHDALTRKKRVILEDIRQNDLFNAGIQAMQSTPIMTRSGNPLGVLSTYYRGSHKINERELRLLDMLVRQAADVIEHLHTREALRESEERYRTLFNSMSEGFALHEIICDNNGNPCDYRFLEANLAFEKFTGLKIADTLGKTLRETIPDIDELWLKTYDQVARSGKPAHFENYFKPLNKYYEISVYRSMPKRIAAVFTDITERKQIEIALRQSQHDLNRAQAVAGIGSWRMDCRYNILTWSDECYRLFGIPAGTPLTYESFLSCVHPDDREFVDRKWRAALDGEPYDFEHKIIVHGEQRWVHQKAELEFDAAGNLLGGFGTTQDITERKKAEAKIEEGNRILKALMEFVPEGITLATAPDLKVFMVSRAGQEMLGGVHENMTMQDAAAEGIVYYPDGSTKIPAEDLPLARAIQKGEIIKDREIIQVNTKGERLFLSCNAAPIRDRDGKITGGIVAWHDIAKRKNAEEILKRDKETLKALVEKGAKELLDAQAGLEKAKRLSDIGILAATVAHELRNPLAAINMSAYNIARKIKNPKIHKNLANIEKKIMESDQIITNLLFYSRIKPSHHEKIDIFNLLDESADETAGLKQNIVINKDFSGIKNLLIEADPVQIKEVADNILHNAVDACGKTGGVITIRARSRNGRVVIRIKDTGKGMAKAELEKIMEPFYTTKAKGTGLGLTVCQQIIRLHDGLLHVTSTEGKGTAVTVSLPIKRNGDAENNPDHR